MLPYRKTFTIIAIYNYNDERVFYAKPGENVKLKCKGLEDNDISKGFMVCDDDYVNICQEFEATIDLIDLPLSKPIFTQGYLCVLHLHQAVEEVEVSAIISAFEQNNIRKANYLKPGMKGTVRLRCKQYLCLDKATANTHLGCFTLRDEGITIALGKVVKIKLIKKDAMPLQQEIENSSPIKESKSENTMF